MNRQRTKENNKQNPHTYKRTNRRLFVLVYSFPQYMNFFVSVLNDAKYFAIWTVIFPSCFFFFFFLRRQVQFGYWWVSKDDFQLFFFLFILYLFIYLFDILSFWFSLSLSFTIFRRYWRWYSTDSPSPLLSFFYFLFPIFAFIFLPFIPALFYISLFCLVQFIFSFLNLHPSIYIIIFFVIPQSKKKKKNVICKEQRSLKKIKVLIITFINSLQQPWP